MDSSLKQLVNEWLRLDENEETRAQVRDLYNEQNFRELDRIMKKRIEFGTAGLRGQMGAGWSRMNDLIVIQTSQGLCAYIDATISNGQQRGIVVGHDHRHHSRHWARLVAMVFLNKGYKVYHYREFVHTPLIPFAVSHLKAACGVMITASHNPKQDNGLKVYWENAVQIIAPHDTGIAEAILHNLSPHSWDTNVVDSSEACIHVASNVLDAYMESLSTFCHRKNAQIPFSSDQLKIVNSSMHGVSHRYIEMAFKLSGLHPVFPVKAQQQPDPDFPTLPFPNPEEKGALDLAICDADVAGITYVIAQDPDADRFCAAQKENGKWHIFTGDQLGTIFAAYCLDVYRSSNKSLDKLAMVSSAVSSKMMEAMAQKEGFRYEESLTGFKYIGTTAQRLEARGFEVPFGYEEAIGFMIGTSIRDKDGICASVHFTQLANQLHQDGTTVLQYLHKQYERYGFFETMNNYFVCHDTVIIHRIFSRLRSFRPHAEGHGSSLARYPCSIGNLNITSVRDLTVGYDSSKAPTFKPDLPISLGHMITFRAISTDLRVQVGLTIRTSGTEPKIKFYLEGSGEDREGVHKVLEEVVDDLRHSWMEAEKHDLTMP